MYSRVYKYAGGNLTYIVLPANSFSTGDGIAYTKGKLKKIKQQKRTTTLKLMHKTPKISEWTAKCCPKKVPNFVVDCNIFAIDKYYHRNCACPLQHTQWIGYSKNLTICVSTTTAGNMVHKVGQIDNDVPCRLIMSHVIE